MAKTVKVNFRIDADLKKGVDELAKKLHMSFSALMNVYAAQLVREQRIPFEITAVPFEDEIEELPVDNIIADGVSEEQLKRWMK